MRDTGKNFKTMSLKQYLEATGMKQKFLAEKIGVPEKTLGRVLSGYAPSLKMAIELERFTQGIVSVYEWDLTKTAHCIKPEATDNNKNKQGNT